MAWNKFVVPAKQNDVGTGVKVTLSKRKVSPARLVMTFSADCAAKFGWLGSDKLEVMIGDGEHHGLVRLRKNNSAAGSAVIEEKSSSVGSKRNYFKVSFGVIASLVDRSEPTRWAQYQQVDGGWVEITLPSWAAETSPKQSVAHSTLNAAAQFQRPRRDAASTLMGDPPAGRSALDAKRG